MAKNTVNLHLDRFIECMSADQTRPKLASIAMLDDYLVATDGHIAYGYQVERGSIPSGKIDKSQITKDSTVKITSDSVTVDGAKIKFDTERPFTQQVIDQSIKNTNDLATIIDPKGLLKLIKQFATITTVNPANGRKSNRKRVLMLIDMTNGALIGCAEHDVSDRVVLGDCSKFIEFPRNVDNKNPISFDYLAFQPVFIMRILKALGKDCDYITWRFNRDIHFP